MAATLIDLLAPWTTGVVVRPVVANANAHTIHTYFNACPESPDGRQVLLFQSTAADGHFGDICVVERATGKLRVLAKDIHTEDAHRVAMQQWISNGRRVAFHDLRDGRWVIAVVDVDTGKESVLAHDRLIGFGTPSGDLLPIYGPHWNPGEFRDLQLLNVATGQITTPVTNQSVRDAYPDFIAKHFGESPTSIFFPVMSPDGQRIFFKMSAVVSGNMLSGDASNRQGLTIYDLKLKKFTHQREKWGHPSWHPNSQAIIDVQSEIWDLPTNTVTKIPGMPHFSGSHPSVSRDRKLYVTDAHKFDGKESEWGVVVANIEGDHYTVIHRFSMAGGAQSWRRAHPHPQFSADGRRIYFNGEASPWNTLFVAEIPAQEK